MRVPTWIAGVLFISVASLGSNVVASWPGRCQDEKPDAATLAAMRAELEAARDAQARQLEMIQALTAQAEVAKQATTVAELRANKLLQIAQERLQSAEALAAQADKDADDATAAETQRWRLGDLVDAQSQHAAAVDFLTQVQADTKQAQDYYQVLTDAQANAALQDFVVANVSGYGNAQAQSQDYWIGVQCEPAIEVQVRIDQSSDRLVTLKGGLRVIAITAESPAQTASVVEQDVILFMNDRPTNQIEELVVAIDENGEKSASLQIVREHNPMTLSITPLKRPQTETVREGVEFNAYPHWLRYNGVPLAYGTAELPKLPSGFEADVHFVGGSQPEFNIKTSDQSWAVNGENIDQLPEEVRPFAQHIWGMLSSGQSGKWRVVPGQYYNYALEGLKSPHPYAPAVGSYLRRADFAAEADGSATNAKLDQLQKQVNELRELIERLQK